MHVLAYLSIVGSRNLIIVDHFVSSMYNFMEGFSTTCYHGDMGGVGTFQIK